MRTILFSIFALLALTLQAQFHTPGFVANLTSVASGGGPPVCSVVASQTDTNASSFVGFSTNYYYQGEIIINSPGGSLCQVDFLLGASGNISTKTFNAILFSFAAGTTNLNEVLATSANVTGNNSWAGGWVTFTFSEPYALTAGGSYALVVTMNAFDGSNFANEYHRTGDGGLTMGYYARFGNDKLVKTVYFSGDMGIRIYTQ